MGLPALLSQVISPGAVRTVIRAESPVAPRRRLSCPRRVATTCKLYTVVLVEIYRTQDGSRLNRHSSLRAMRNAR